MERKHGKMVIFVSVCPSVAEGVVRNVAALYFGVRKKQKQKHKKPRKARELMDHIMIPAL